MGLVGFLALFATESRPVPAGLLLENAPEAGRLLFGIKAMLLPVLTVKSWDADPSDICGAHGPHRLGSVSSVSCGRALSVGSQSCRAEETWWTLHPITLLYKSQGVAPLGETWAQQQHLPEEWVHLPSRCCVNQ